MFSAREKDSLNLVFAADDNYAMPLAVAIRSALERLHGTAPRVFILDIGMSGYNRRRVLTSWTGLSIQPVWIPLAEAHLRQLSRLPASSFSGTQHISHSAYARLMLGELMPRDIHRVIYLDCDILVGRP